MKYVSTHMKKINVIIIHGAYGHPEENWFGWLKRELQKIEVACYVPALPTPENQNPSSWIEAFNLHFSWKAAKSLRDGGYNLNQSCGSFIHAHTVMIGHSLGAAFILRWLEKHDVDLFASILVGAFLGEVGFKQFDSINQPFFETPFSWEIIRKRSRQFFCYHGENDPYVSRNNFDFIAEHLDARKIILANAGHMNTASGYSQFPQLLLHLKELMEQVR